jgi:hypothetical protein
MNREAVARKLVKIAEGLVSKTYPKILADDRENRKIWLEIEDAAHAIVEKQEAEGMDESGVIYERQVRQEAERLAMKYGPRAIEKNHRELINLIVEYIWEAYHHGDR